MGADALTRHPDRSYLSFYRPDGHNTEEIKPMSKLNVSGRSAEGIPLDHSSWGKMVHPRSTTEVNWTLHVNRLAQAVRAANEAAERMCEQLRYSTPDELGWPDKTAEELIAAEWRSWFEEEQRIARLEG